MAGPLDIRLHPVWRFGAQGKRELDVTLLALLDGIEQSGKLTTAAKSAGISHRHAWNLIEGWSAFLGAPLVVVERGRGTKLSELGAKLLWTGKRALARLEPELDNLAAELMQSLSDAVAGAPPVVRVHASHDFALARLRQIAGSTRALAIDLRYRGSLEALASLRRGTCDFAGFHITDGPLGVRAAHRYAEMLGRSAHRLICLATRVQGLIVPAGNPYGMRGAGDLRKAGVRFVNRQRDSGTRLLLDELLAAERIDAADIVGYENEEHTHAAVAAYVAGAMADVGLGIEAAALQFQLGFVPLATERYFLAAHKDTLEKPEAKYLIGLLRGDAFHDAVVDVHGDRTHRTGEIVQLRNTPPWDKLLAG